MSCLDADTVLAWVDGELTGQRALDVESHIDGCAACRKLVSETAAASDHDPTAAAAGALPPPSAGAPTDRDPPAPAAGAAPAPAGVAPVPAGAARVTPPGAASRRSRGRLAPLALAVAFVAMVAVVVAGALLLWRGWPARGAATAAPAVIRLVHRPGQVISARSGPDGLYVSAAFGDGIGVDGVGALSIARLDSGGELVPLRGTGGMVVAAASPRALAVLRDVTFESYTLRGTVALLDGAGKPLPLAGDTADVVAAELMPSGQLAVIRARAGGHQIEAPLGTVVYRAASPGQLWSLRVAGHGELAFVETLRSDVRVRCQVKTLMPGAAPRVIGGEWTDAMSVAWAGDALLITGSRGRLTNAIWRVARPDRDDPPDALWSAARMLAIQDVTADRAVIVSELAGTHRVFARRPGWDRDHDLSWSDRSPMVELSLDGNWLSLLDQSAGNDEPPRIYVRSLDGGDAIPIGRGVGGLLSRDGRQALSHAPLPPWRLVVGALPAAGWDPAATRSPPRGLDPGDLTTVHAMSWLGDDALAILADGAQGTGVYVQPLDGPPRRRGGWPGARHGLFRASPDGLYIGDVDRDGNPALIELATLGVTTIPGHAGDAIVGWSADSAAVWIADLRRWPVVVTRHPRSGPESRQLEIAAPGPGVMPLEQLRVAGDGETYAYSVSTVAFQLYRLEGMLR